MDQERWKEVNRIFHSALAIPASERHQFVVSSSNGDQAMQKEVEQLLQADQEAGSYLEKPFLHDTKSDAPPLQEGDLLCRRFRVIREIAEGGMGRVYEAFDSELGVKVALKVIRPEIASDPKALARFRREVTLARTITHSNVCRTFDIERDFLIDERGERREMVFLTMEFLDGETLSAFLKREGKMPTALAMTLAGQIASAIDAAHDLGIVHRDLKPGNVMLVSSGNPNSEGPLRAVITDFGLARLASLVTDVDAPTNSNSLGWPVGTLAYMSPEQLQGLVAGPAADIYAFGLILFEMVTGKRAFPAENFLGGIEERVRGPGSSLNEQLQGQSQAWREAINWCLRANPSERAASATDVVETLIGTRQAPHFTEGLRKGRKQAALWVGAALLTAVPAWYFYHPQSTLRMSSYQQLTRDGKTKYIAGTDGTWIYMTGGPTSFARVSVNGGEVEAMSTKPLPASSVLAWDISRDGSKALIGVVEGGTVTSLWSAPIDSGPPTRLAIGENLTGTFTPDGDSVLYLTNDGDVHRVQVDGTADRKLASLGQNVTDIRMSPNSKVIRVFKNGSPWEMSADGTGLHRLFPNWHGPLNVCCGRWSFDGTLYSFMQVEDNGFNQIWGVEEQHGFFHRSNYPIQLTSGPTEWDRPVPGKDGSVMYSVGINYRGELSRADLRSGGLHPFLGGITAEHVAFSPDGKYIVYTAYPVRVLWRANRDGSNQVQLTSGEISFVMNPVWSPDSKQILFVNSPVQGPAKAYVLPLEGGTPTLLLPGDQEAQGDPNWSPDGRRIVLTGGDISSNSRQYLRILDLTTHQVTRVPGSNGFWSPRWSPDGHYLAALSGSSLKVFGFGTQKWSSLGVPDSISYPFFSRDSRYLYYLRSATGDESRGVYRIRVAGGEPQRVFDLNEWSLSHLWGASMSLDPSDVPLLTRDRGSSDVYSLHIER